MSETLEARLGRRLAAVRNADRWRRLRILDGAQLPEQTTDGRPVLAFCSNDYLGLAGDPRVVLAARQALDRYGMGAGAAHLVNGHTRAHAELEEALADFTGRPRALLFSTGYMANLGVMQALLGRHDTVLEDRLNHASLLDATRFVGCRVRRYDHSDPDHAASLLPEPAPGHDCLVVTDGVFSMDGDIAPLPDLVRIAKQKKAWLMVDDAHGLGVLGDHGAGTCEHYRLADDDIPILMGTLGKAFGTAGAFVAGSNSLIEGLMHFARTYIYTTAMPAALAAAARVALTIARDEDWRRDHLRVLITRLQQGLDQLGLPRPASPTPIQPLVLGSSRATSEVASALLAAGILIPAIRPPTVPEGEARLRITLSARHSETHVDRLIETLGRVLATARASHPTLP